MFLIVSGMLLLWLLEGAIPFMSMRYKRHKWGHASVNFTFTVIHLVIHTGFAFFYCAALRFLQESQLGTRLLVPCQCALDRGTIFPGS